jgi:hypothetical protein
MGATFSTGGKGAQGDLTGVGGPGGFATSVGFSVAPLRISPFPDPLDIPPSLTAEDADVCGAGESDLGVSELRKSLTEGIGAAFDGMDTTSSACGSVIFVPSVHSIDSGAQSSSSSSISAQLACLLGSSD